MTTNPYSPPTARVGDREDLEEAPALWNPNAAANWSLLFSPAFGAFLHMLNWQALGETGKAAAAKGWFIASLVLLALYIVFAIVLPDTNSVDRATRLIALVYLITWYFAAGRAQARYVKDKFGTTYPRNGWGKPLLLAVLATAGYTAVAIAIGLLLAR